MGVVRAFELALDQHPVVLGRVRALGEDVGPERSGRLLLGFQLQFAADGVADQLQPGFSGKPGGEALRLAGPGDAQVHTFKGAEGRRHSVAFMAVQGDVVRRAEDRATCYGVSGSTAKAAAPPTSASASRFVDVTP